MKFPALSAVLVLGAAVFAATPASAAPMVDRGVVDAIQHDQAQVQKARLVCNAWGRCWRTRPRYYAPLYAPRPYYRPYRAGPRVVCNSWGRCWRRW